MTLVPCEESVRQNVFFDKVFNIVMLPILAAMLVRARQRQSSAASGNAGLRDFIVALITLYCILGALHATLLIAHVPTKTSPNCPVVAFWLMEFTFSTYNALLLAALGLLNQAWLDILHSDAYPHAAGIRAQYLGTAKSGVCFLLVVPLGVAVAADTVTGYMGIPVELGVDVQHLTFMLVCGTAGITFIYLSSQCLRDTKAFDAALDAELDTAFHADLNDLQAAFDTTIEPNLGEPHSSLAPSSGRHAVDRDMTRAQGRVWAAQVLLCLIWTFCAIFCTFCGLAGGIRRIGASSAWSESATLGVQYSFIVYDLGAIMVAKMAYIMLFWPATLDKPVGCYVACSSVLGKAYAHCWLKRGHAAYEQLQSEAL